MADSTIAGIGSVFGPPDLPPSSAVGVVAAAADAHALPGSVLRPRPRPARPTEELATTLAHSSSQLLVAPPASLLKPQALLNFSQFRDETRVLPPFDQLLPLEPPLSSAEFPTADHRGVLPPLWRPRRGNGGGGSRAVEPKPSTPEERKLLDDAPGFVVLAAQPRTTERAAICL